MERREERRPTRGQEVPGEARAGPDQAQESPIGQTRCSGEARSGPEQARNKLRRSAKARESPGEAITDIEQAHDRPRACLVEAQKPGSPRRDQNRPRTSQEQAQSRPRAGPEHA